MALHYLEDANIRVDYKKLMRTLFNMKIDPHIIIWIGSALLKQKVVLRVGPWTSEVKMITRGLLHGSALSPVFYNIYTAELTSNELEAHSQTNNFADVSLLYCQGRNREEIARSVKSELDRYNGLKVFILH